VHVRVQGRSFPAQARVLLPERDAELLAAVQKLSREKYDWGEGPIVELRPQTHAEE